MLLLSLTVQAIMWAIHKVVTVEFTAVALLFSYICLFLISVDRNYDYDADITSMNISSINYNLPFVVLTFVTSFSLLCF